MSPLNLPGPCPCVLHTLQLPAWLAARAVLPFQPDPTSTNCFAAVEALLCHACLPPFKPPVSPSPIVTVVGSQRLSSAGRQRVRQRACGQEIARAVSQLPIRREKQRWGCTAHSGSAREGRSCWDGRGELRICGLPKGKAKKPWIQTALEGVGALYPGNGHPQGAAIFLMLDLLRFAAAGGVMRHSCSAADQARSRRRPASAGAGAGAPSSDGAASPDGAGAVSKDCAAMLPPEGLQGGRGALHERRERWPTGAAQRGGDQQPWEAGGSGMAGMPAGRLAARQLAAHLGL